MPARLAPSAVNSQPWYFTHEGDLLHAYCAAKGNSLDVGIALVHLYVSHAETFRFIRENAAEVSGYRYIGTFQL